MKQIFFPTRKRAATTTHATGAGMARPIVAAAGFQPASPWQPHAAFALLRLYQPSPLLFPNRTYNHRVAVRFAIFLLGFSALVTAQTASVKELMLDLIHPASNDLLLAINRGGPSTDPEWSAARRSALTLAQSGMLLAPQINSDAWRAAVARLSNAGEDAYKAAQAKDAKTLAAATARIDASCTACHKQFRPNVFPRAGV